MASEVSHRHSATGDTLYFTIRSTALQMWSTAGTPNFEALTVANWGDYDVALAETPASSYFYVGTFPAISGNMVAGWYSVDVFKQLGGSPAIGDTLLTTLFGYWDGTTFKLWANDTTHVGGTLQTAGDIVAAIGNISITGSPAYKESASFTVTGGTITETNDYTFTTTSNASYHSLTPATTSIDGYYTFQLEADEVAVSVAFKGRLFSNPTAGRTVAIQVWDWTLGSPDWVTVDTINAVNSDSASSDVSRSTILVSKYTGTGANLGTVRIRTYGTSLTTSTPFRVDQLVIGKTIKTGGITNGSTVTLAGSNTNKTYEGYNWILALGGQDISGSYFRGARQVTGTSSGTTPVTFEDCIIGSGSAGATLPPGTYIRCVFNTPSGQPFTAASAGQYVFIDCVSGVAGSGTPYFDFSPVSSTTGINFRRWSGGSYITTDSNCTGTMEVVTGGGQTLVTGGASWELRGICRSVTVTLTGSETVRIDAVTGPVTIDGVGTGSTVRVYGVTSTITSTASGTPTIDNSSLSQATVNTEVDTALADYDPPTNAELEARTLLAAEYATNVTSGTGARTVTITVNDGTNPLESAKVRLTKGAETYLQMTDVNGQVTFNVDDGSWIIAITLFGYTYSGTTLVVNGDETATYSMSGISVPTPDSADEVTGYITCLDDDNDPVQGKVITFKMTRGAGDDGFAVSGNEITMTSDANGIAQHSFIRGATYEFRYGTSTNRSILKAPLGTASTWLIGEIIGKP